MKTLYQISRKTTETAFDRSKAVKAYLNLAAVREGWKQFREVVVKNEVPMNVSNMSRYVKDLKENFRRLVHKPSTYEITISRMIRGKRYSVVINRSRGDTFLDGKEEIKNRIKRDRMVSKQRNDALALRPTGFYLKKMIQKTLTEAKKPYSKYKFVGIEIECIMPKDANLELLLPFKKWVNLGSDGSISDYGRNEEGRELRICLERRSLRRVIPPLLKTLRDMGARVNKSCGLHVHLDQRNVENPAVTYANLVRSLNLLTTVIAPSRRHNQYCGRNRDSRFDVARNGGRYKMINATAYYKYKTIEIRMFGGTLEEEKIINWVETLWAIAEGKSLLRCPKNFDTARQYWKLSDANVLWLKERQAKFAAVNPPVVEEVSDAPDEEPESNECDECGMNVEDDGHSSECSYY